jgi:hypothetical protein
LEEDHYVAEDFVSVLRLAEAVRNEKHPDCDIICIGTYLKTYNYNRDHKMVKKILIVFLMYQFTLTLWRSKLLKTLDNC